MANIERVLRRIVLPVFRQVNVGDVTIRHHWTGDPIRLHSFQHKGYWWHGRRREQPTMEMFGKLVRKGDTVFDIGSHIGYVGNYLAWLAGPAGRVFCFEPSPLNLPYIRTNAAQCSFRNMTIIEAAAGGSIGDVPLFVETITGQNSSILSDFTTLKTNSSFNGLATNTSEVRVKMLTADSVGQVPDFVKIDTEGAEFFVLSGMQKILRDSRPRIMVETEDHSRAVELLQSAGYKMSRRFDGNLFAIHHDDIAALEIISE